MTPSLWYRLRLPTRHEWVRVRRIEEPGISDVENGKYHRILAVCRHCGGARAVWWMMPLNPPSMTLPCRLDRWPPVDKSE